MVHHEVDEGASGWVDGTLRAANHPPVGEYALVTAVVASLAVALASIPDSQLATRLPTTTARAGALVAQTARQSRVPVHEARAAMRRAPYARPPLRYLYATGWIGGRTRPADCVFARASEGSTRKRLEETIRRDARLRSRLARLHVTVPAAAAAITRGTAAAC